MTVQVMMTMPDPPEGWEYTGEFRHTKAGESAGTGNMYSLFGAASQGEFPILRKVWVPHRMLKPGWVYPYCRNVWYWTDMEPIRNRDGSYMAQNEAATASLSSIAKCIEGFTLPEAHRLYQIGESEVSQ